MKVAKVQYLNSRKFIQGLVLARALQRLIRIDSLQSCHQILLSEILSLCTIRCSHSKSSIHQNQYICFGVLPFFALAQKNRMKDTGILLLHEFLMCVCLLAALTQLSL